MRRFFTVEEANALIPALEALIKRLNVQREKMGGEFADIEKVHESVRGNGGHPQGGPYLNEIFRFTSLIQEIHRHGCILKDVAQGLVDFPSLKDGREVYLCWMLGEESVEWWHERETGFAGRQPIETL